MAVVGEYKGIDVQVIAAGTIAQYAVVKLTTDSTEGDQRVVVSAAVADVAYGIAQEAASSGDSIPVRIAGISRVKADGAYALGDELSVADTNGEVDTAAPAAGVNHYVVGLALHAATAAGDTLPIIVRFYMKQGA